MGKRLDVNWRRLPLGVLPDAVLARRLGCTKVTVRAHRARLGIEALCASEQTCLRQIVIDCLPDRCPLPTLQIKDLVGEIYGEVGLRRLYRVLSRLVHEGIAVNIRDGHAREWGYQLAQRRSRCAAAAVATTASDDCLVPNSVTRAKRASRRDVATGL